MEATALKKKKNTISKGKIKKTIKNIICRPDSISWPLVTDQEAVQLESELREHSIDIPHFEKLHWNELKLIPKDQRPKQPPRPKINGLIFGISECQNALEKKQCSAILIEAKINPRTIAEPIIAVCQQTNIPVLCLNNLKTTCAKNFGIPTSCLGIQEYMKDLSKKIHDISQTKPVKVVNEISTKQDNEMSESKENKEIELKVISQDPPYLYRSNKKTRVFIPIGSQVTEKIEAFTGQQFVKMSSISTNSNSNDKKFKKMLLKRVSNNPNRVKVKNK